MIVPALQPETLAKKMMHPAARIENPGSRKEDRRRDRIAGAAIEGKMEQ
jgi:hypothetical protein